MSEFANSVIDLGNLIESRLVGVTIEEDGRLLALSFIKTDGARLLIALQGVERFLLSEMRNQNVVESVTTWSGCCATEELRDTAFALIAGRPEADCDQRFVPVVDEILGRVARRGLVFLELRAIYGAEVLACAESIAVQEVAG